jgi:hypothetical protein
MCWPNLGYLFGVAEPLPAMKEVVQSLPKHLYIAEMVVWLPQQSLIHTFIFFLMCCHELNGLFKMNGQLNNIAPCTRLKWLGIIIYTTLAKEQGSQLFFFSFKKEKKRKRQSTLYEISKSTF